MTYLVVWTLVGVQLGNERFSNLSGVFELVAKLIGFLLGIRVSPRNEHASIPYLINVVALARKLLKGT